ncbi:hypothetical protein LTR08_001803 [Meristemomyces frigidus]|nr:hypothetical protein LTR08_001803 [Meristemomyces frigidus]
MAATKRKASAIDASKSTDAPPFKRRASSRKTSAAATIVNPDLNGDIIDGPDATRASPDSDVNDAIVPGPLEPENGMTRSESPLSDAPHTLEVPRKRVRATGKKLEGGAAVREAEEVVSAVVDAASSGKAAPIKRGRGKIVKQERDSDVEAEAAMKVVDDASSSVKPAPAKKGRGKKVKQEDDGDAEIAAAPKKGRGKRVKQEEAGDAEDTAVKPTAPAKKAKSSDEEQPFDPDAEDDEVADEEEVKQAMSRPPPVNSDYLPLPWKGRLGYACLNTYLRLSNPPVFSSRTCRIQSILEHRHPLQDETQPEHPTKNKPDKSKPADVARGTRYVEHICLANVRDIAKMIRWNDKFGIRFLRLSSEMFPFASHPEYGYKLEPFAAEALAEVGKVIAELGHRVTTHPGQFTQLGSPRKSVTDNARRDLEYHDELLSLLKLPEQANRDAVMILHMGGIFEGKEETIQRFRENYASLSQSVKNRLVLENDDVCYSVHDLLPICEELNIPMVLDYHHNNIVFNASQIREGTKDIMDLYPRIKAMWDKKGIKQKMHYSEPTPPAVTGRQRRKHSPRVATLPPCADDMDLMIEAKDKEQAVFELMRTFKLPGYDTFNDIVPYVRNDDNKVALATMNKKKKKDAEEDESVLVPDDEVGMGGPEGRVYWPPGMDEWLRPKKREVKKKAEPEGGKSKEQIKKEAAEAYAAREAGKKAAKEEALKEEDEESDEEATPATKKAKAAMRKKEVAAKVKAVAKAEMEEAKKMAKESARVEKEEARLVKGEGSAGKAAPKARKPRVRREAVEVEAAVPTPSPSEDEAEESQLSMAESDGDDEVPISLADKRRTVGSRTTGGRQAKSKKVSYVEDGDESMAEAEA